METGDLGKDNQLAVPLVDQELDQECDTVIALFHKMVDLHVHCPME